MDYKAALRILSDPIAWEIFHLLLNRPMCQQALASLTGVKAPSVSKKCNELLKAGLITSTPHGNSREHNIDFEGVQELHRKVEEILKSKGEQVGPCWALSPASLPGDGWGCLENCSAVAALRGAEAK